MREENNYQPTHLTREWCDTHVADKEPDLALGFNPDSPAYRVSQGSEHGSDYFGAEYEAEEDGMSYNVGQ